MLKRTKYLKYTLEFPLRSNHWCLRYNSLYFVEKNRFFCDTKHFTSLGFGSYNLQTIRSTSINYISNLSSASHFLFDSLIVTIKKTYFGAIHENLL